MLFGNASQHSLGNDSRRVSGSSVSSIANTVHNLKHISGNELGSNMSALLLNRTTYDSIRNWIMGQRMSHLPPEDSDYDKALAWAQLFVERLHMFDKAIKEFHSESGMATQFAYGSCSILFNLGKVHAKALMTSFRFFYTMSMPMVNLLERTELLNVSQEIQEQLALALSDLVVLVVSVATRLDKAKGDASTKAVSVEIYSTFSRPIKAFLDRCENVAEAMWRYRLLVKNRGVEAVSDVKLVKHWLAPEDHVLTIVAVGRSLLAHDREGFTCSWVAPHLTRFLTGQDKILSISGQPGSGKSVLSSVIVEYLQRPIAGVHYNALYIPISMRIPLEASSRAVAKTILGQLFEKRAGNVKLLEILCGAHDRSKKASTYEEYDDILWDAVEHGLAAALPGARELILVVSGINEVSCNESALFQRLTKATANGTNVRLISLGCETSPAMQGLMSIHMSEDLISDDIMAVVRNDFDSDNEFSQMSEYEQESTVTRLAEASAGSFLWAKLATKRLRRAIGLDKLREAINTVVTTKPTIRDFVLREIQSPNMKDEARHMLAWLAIANRPLSLRELETLASIDVGKGTISDHRVDVELTMKHVHSLVFVQDQVMYIRHGLIRSALLDMLTTSELVPAIKDVQGDLVARLLLYIKTVVPDQHKPSTTLLDAQETNHLLEKNPLLDFAVLHWPIHLTKTQDFEIGGEKGAAKAFSGVYPTNITALLLQASLWENRPKAALLAYQRAITNIYRQLFTTKSTLTLQALIFLAVLNRQVGKVDQAAPIFFEATTISNELLGTSHTVTVQMANSYLEVTESKITSSVTDIMTKREEVFNILIESYKATFGETSTQVISVMRQLAQHYRFVHEEHKAQQVSDNIRSITAKKGGDYVDADNALHVQLGKTGSAAIEDSNTLLLDIEEQDDLIGDSGSYSFSAILSKAERAAAEGHIQMAERLYVELWHRVSQEYRSQHSQLLAERNLQALLSYSRFLHSQQRTSEASAILVSIWKEYSMSTSSIVTETSASLLIQVAQVMKSVGLSSEALSVFKYCEQHYRATNRTKSSTYQEIQESIQATSQEVLQTTSSSTTQTLSETTLEEMIIESSSSTSTENRTTTLSVTSSLVSLFTSEHRWHDASRLIKKVLRSVWSSFFSANAQDVTMVQEHADTCMYLAGRLAECYHARRRVAREENIRVRLYYALRKARKVDDTLRNRATMDLLMFYRRTSQTESIIHLQQEMLDDYTEFYGDRHPTVIKILWELAELTSPRPIFLEYYQRIIHALNKDSETSTPEALPAVIIVARELWSRGHFSEALPYYRTLFTTFLKNPKISPKFEDQEWVRSCFSRYTDCLRSLRTSLSTLHDITSQYQARCKTLFGASASITVQATLTLARLCQESKTLEKQAIALYEELMNIETGEIDDQRRQEIQADLEMLYDEQLSYSSVDDSSSHLSNSVTILRKRITSVREQHGWAHEESLSRLTDLVRLHHKQGKTEEVVHELEEATKNILSTEISSTRLLEAASTIASNYIAVNQVQKATELVDQVYSQILMKETADSSKTQLDVSACGRESLIFLAQLEHSLHRSSAALTEILADLTTQYVYFEKFRALITSSSSFHDVSVASARLHYSLVTSGRYTAAAQVFKRFCKLFNDTEAKRLNLMAHLSTAQVQIFLHSLLDHLGTHRSKDILRSVGIIGNAQVSRLHRNGRFDDASDLALACFHYIATHKEAYETTTLAKLVLTMGMTVGGRKPATTPSTTTPDSATGATAEPDKETQNKLLGTSRTILHSVLQVLDKLNINLARLGMANLNQLIGLLGEQQDWESLASLMVRLWNSRETQQQWPPSLTFALVRRYIFACWRVPGRDSKAALRMAEHIVYNCRRVLGLRDPITLEMSTLLSQLYTGLAQRYQKELQGDTEKNGSTMANRYYRKAAAIHETILRVYSDPVYASMDDVALMDSVNGHFNSASPGASGELSPPLQFDFDHLPARGQDSMQSAQNDGEHVRHHLHLLKLAVQRLGYWPKDYAEYERLNADVFREYGAYLQGVEGVEKWDLKAFGNGKAEADDDLLQSKDLAHWELPGPDSLNDGHNWQRDEVEEEL
ncbi:hypothetical protein C7999DRAFT_16221 [Corynascus novoguineensis]|uniref:Nephrocystin 3-like N-terminal domain-containing protein n=1 Tax=Corynascus novoguineensis TaxID=1126955 RepID=A0AAN7CP00_9PEZI|nr:hypothetical protein C7999DRAFT_16221 [Corynascus novoguineensis]